MKSFICIFLFTPDDRQLSSWLVLLRVSIFFTLTRYIRRTDITVHFVLNSLHALRIKHVKVAVTREGNTMKHLTKETAVQFHIIIKFSLQNAPLSSWLDRAEIECFYWTKNIDHKLSPTWINDCIPVYLVYCLRYSGNVYNTMDSLCTMFIEWDFSIPY